MNADIKRASPLNDLNISLPVSAKETGIEVDLTNVVDRDKYATVILLEYEGELLYTPENEQVYPTGTCLPFSKKVFITVNGKILPCERIGHQFALGEITNDSVNLDIKQITQKYNHYFAKLDSQCSRCYNSKSCIQCIFNLMDIEKTKCSCNGFMNEDKGSSII